RRYKAGAVSIISSPAGKLGLVCHDLRFGRKARKYNTNLHWFLTDVGLVPVVIARLDPAIYPTKEMDARVKPTHDDCRSTTKIPHRLIRLVEVSDILGRAYYHLCASPPGKGHNAFPSGAAFLQHIFNNDSLYFGYQCKQGFQYEEDGTGRTSP